MELGVRQAQDGGVPRQKSDPQALPVPGPMLGTRYRGTNKVLEQADRDGDLDTEYPLSPRALWGSQEGRGSPGKASLHSSV